MDPELKAVRDTLIKKCIKNDFAKIIAEANLSKEQQAFVIARFVYNKKYVKIAAENNTSPETVKYQLHQVYVKLTNCLDRIMKE